MGCYTKALFAEAAAFDWILVKLAIEHDDKAVLKNFRQRGFFKQGELQKVEERNEVQYKAATLGKSASELALATLALAYCRAGFGKFDEGKELASKASATSQFAYPPRKLFSSRNIISRSITAFLSCWKTSFSNRELSPPPFSP